VTKLKTNTGKGKGKGIAVCETSPHRYRKSLTIWDHTVLPATRQRWLSHLHPKLVPCMQLLASVPVAYWARNAKHTNFLTLSHGTQFSDPEGMQGWVDLGTMGANSLPKTATRQRRDCNSNPCSSEPESGTLTTCNQLQVQKFDLLSSDKACHRLDNACCDVKFQYRSITSWWNSAVHIGCEPVTNCCWFHPFSQSIT